MRIAFVDLLFCWSPNGGADVDLYNVASGLAAAGLDIRLFVLQLAGSEGRGQLQPDALPFPAEIVAVPSRSRSHNSIAAVIRTAVDAWRPSVVFLMHGYALKAHVARALRHYPLVGRYYAHELLCARDALRFKNDAACPCDIFSTPDICRRCAFSSLTPEIKSGALRAFAEDYVLAKAYAPGYYPVVRQSLEAMTRIIVSNEELRQELGPFADKAVVLPGGVSFPETPHHHTRCADQAGQKIIFMAGRVDDPLKGLHVLLDAAALLGKKRSDFHILVTHFDSMFRGEFFSSTGWLTHEETLRRYYEADVCVVPSLWREPFGLVAVEAMAAQLPVCASDTGGLHDIVVHGKTGFLFPPGDSARLAEQLDMLLTDAPLRETLGAAGRERALSLYSWDAVIRQHYLPLLDALHGADKGDE